jgi:hypothetical protein
VIRPRIWSILAAVSLTRALVVPLVLLVACPGPGASTVGGSSGDGTASTGEPDPTTGANTTAGTTSAGTTSAGTSATTAGTTSASTTSSATTTTTSAGTTGGELPPLGADACEGYATRYWDCCKAHCGWPGNVNPATDPLQSCDQADQSHGAVYDVASACQSPASDSAFTCWNMAPWAVNDSLAYGFAEVPASGDICGRCYQLEFDGTGHYNAQDPGSVALAGKTMIVQATNIGFDVGGGQFDILTPGGGVGAFDACSFQWGVDTAELGATYGGFMTACQQMGGDLAQIKQCVLSRCAAVFDEPGMADLAAGCEWYVGWYEAADNPNLRYQEVACPPQLVALSGIDRGPLGDVGTCQGGGGTCSQEEMDACDCAWTGGGKNCGQDDGSCCWTACCG